MERRKEEHCNHISEFNDIERDSWRFSSNDFLYKYTKVKSNEENQTEVSGIKTADLTKRLFDMMESFADRMAKPDN